MGGEPRRLRRAFQFLGKAASIDVFERQKGGSVVLVDLMNLHDIGMLQVSDGLGLGSETHRLDRPGVGAAQNHLQGDDTIELHLPGFIDDSHAASPQFLQHLVSGNLQSGEGTAGDGIAELAIRKISGTGERVEWNQGRFSGDTRRTSDLQGTGLRAQLIDRAEAADRTDQHAKCLLRVERCLGRLPLVALGARQKHGHRLATSFP